MILQLSIPRTDRITWNSPSAKFSNFIYYILLCWSQDHIVFMLLVRWWKSIVIEVILGLHLAAILDANCMRPSANCMCPCPWPVIPIATFCQRLKTFLFQQSFPDIIIWHY